MSATRQGINALLKCPWLYHGERDSFTVRIRDPRQLPAILHVLQALPENISIHGHKTGGRELSFSVSNTATLLRNIDKLLEETIRVSDSSAQSERARVVVTDKVRREKKLTMLCKFSAPLIYEATQAGPDQWEDKVTYLFASEEQARLAGFGLWELSHNRSQRACLSAHTIDSSPTFSLSREGQALSLSSGAEILDKNSLHNFIVRLRAAREPSSMER